MSHDQNQITENSNRQTGGSLTPPKRDDQNLAASYIRNQIDAIYDSSDDTQAQAAASQPPQSNNPYLKTHDPTAAAKLEPQKHAGNYWQKYHQAWQYYYQQYYHRYYSAQLQSANQQSETKKAAEPAPTPTSVFSEPDPKPTSATKQLKDELSQKIKTRAQKARKSHHFMPILSAVCVGLLFLFIQFNQLLIARVKAYVSPGATTSQSIIIDPTADTKVGPEPRLIIPKINVDAPVVYSLTSLAEDKVENALRDGVVHYPIPGASSVPGQVGNSVFLGHSSNDVFDSGSYKFVFLLLEKLQKGDRFYLNYEGTRYTYEVTSKKIINPNQLSELQIDTDQPMATLITCVPPGTALKRLLVFAQQVSPDPAAAQTAPEDQGQAPTSIPGNSGSLFQRLFGG